MENAPPAEPAETPEPAPTASPDVKPDAKPKSEWADLGTFVVKLVIIVLIVRSFVFSPFSIPSESMLPRLLIGDYLFITKFNYGFSRHSLPFSVPLLPNLHWSDPTRGDVVVFKAPPSANEDWIKRVIGLPGDTVQMVDGQLILNGKPIPKQRIDDFVTPITPNFPAITAERSHEQGGKCDVQFQKTDAQGMPVCVIPRFRETLPNGKSYEVLDQGMMPCLPVLRVCADNTDLYTVPAGHLFLMGDNRDDSADSRFPYSQGGISYVPMENIEGKAIFSFWSTDGNANWFLPWTWFTAARWSRIGEGF